MTRIEPYYDPLSAAVLQDPGAGYAQLRDVPVHFNTNFDPHFYTLSRYHDVEHALRDVARFSSEFGQGPRFTSPAGMLSDPPQHTFYRGLVQQAFTPKAVSALAPRIADIAEGLLNSRADTSNWDLHDDFAFPLPVIVIAEMLGVPTRDLDHFKRWSDASVAAMGASDPSPYEAELAEMGHYLLRQIAARRERDSNDLISRLVNVEQNGVGLTDVEILGVVTQLLVGGNETTTSLITNAVWRLLDEPERWRRVVADPTLIERALEESLRFDPPVLGLFRNTTCDVELHGVTIPAGSKVMLHYGAANRDPRVFPSPTEFSLDRPLRRHLAFGLGVHFCLGAQLARLEASCALRALVDQCPTLRLLGAGDRIAPFFLWGRRHLPLTG